MGSTHWCGVMAEAWGLCLPVLWLDNPPATLLGYQTLGAHIPLLSFLHRNLFLAGIRVHSLRLHFPEFFEVMWNHNSVLANLDVYKTL